MKRFPVHCQCQCYPRATSRVEERYTSSKGGEWFDERSSLADTIVRCHGFWGFLHGKYQRWTTADVQGVIAWNE
jgi:hypothetical protein